MVDRPRHNRRLAEGCERIFGPDSAPPKDPVDQPIMPRQSRPGTGTGTGTGEAYPRNWSRSRLL